MYVCTYIYLYMYIYLNKGTDSAGTGDHPRRNRLQWFSMETVRCASPGLLGAHFSLALPRVTLQMLGLWARPRFSEKSGKKRTMTYGPIWSQKWWEMVPDTHLQKSHGTMSGEKCSQHLSECRYRSSDLSTRSIDHGRYRRSIRIHLQRITVDRRWCVEVRDNFVVDFIDDTCENFIEILSEDLRSRSSRSKAQCTDLRKLH